MADLQKLSPVQRDLLAEFGNGPDDDRYVTPRYRRTADILTGRGLLRICPGGWYELTALGKAFLRGDDA